jgi:hypothetical protein
MIGFGLGVVISRIAKPTGSAASALRTGQTTMMQFDR